QRLLGVRRLEHLVPPLLEHPAGQRTYGRLVLHEQDRFGAAGTPFHGRDHDVAPWLIGRPGEVDEERRPMTPAAGHGDVTTRLLHDAVNRGEAEPGALAELLGGEER